MSGLLPKFLAAGDAALVVEYGSIIDAALIDQVQRLDRALAAAAPPGLVETVPTFRSLMVHFDPLVTTRAALVAAIEALDLTQTAMTATAARQWVLPACYAAELAPDLSDVATATGLDVDAVGPAHAAARFTVAVVGFLPGCPFLSELPPAFNLPRRTVPRTRVPAGSVAVAQRLSVVYPAESPGGWHLIGNCPAPLFDARRDPPALLAPGDQVRFRPIDLAEHASIRAAAAGDGYDPLVECREAAGTA